MALDKNGKINGKINIVDLLAIILVIAAVIGISTRYITNPSNKVRRGIEIEYEVKIIGVRDFTVKALQKKGTLYDKDKHSLGEIKSVRYENQKQEQFKSDGSVVYVDIPEKYTVYLTVAAESHETDEDYFVGDKTEISAGGWIDVMTKYAHTSGVIVNVESHNDETENKGFLSKIFKKS